MADDEDDEPNEDIPPHPFFVGGGFPFVFISPTDYRTQVVDDDNNQNTSELLNEKKTNEGEEESGETLEDEGDRNETNGEERNDVRISQPKYSQLLKDLDFSRTRMVDVTNLLSDEGVDEDENPKKPDQSSSSSDLSSSNIEIEDKNLTDAANEIQNDLNNLAEIIQAASQIPTTDDTEKKTPIDEDDDTSKQATQNYDLQEEIVISPKSDKNPRFNIPEDNLSSIPRLNTSASHRIEDPISWENLVNGTDQNIQQPTAVIIPPPIPELHTTPTKEQPQPVSPPKERPKSQVDSTSKPKLHYRSRQLSSSSDSDSVAERVVHRTKQPVSQPPLSAEEDFEDLNTHLKQVLLDGDQPSTTTTELRHLSDRPSPSKKQAPQRLSTPNDTWLTMLEKLEREHKERLEKQQKQYEDYMHNLEEKMKQRFEDYVSSTNNLQESKSEVLHPSIYLNRVENSAPGRYRTSSSTYQYRPLARDLTLSQSQSREDISNLRTELSTKHEKHISDLKLYYEHEIDELKNQLNRSRMGHTSSTTTRQSMETIERINNENIRLHEELKELRQLLKKAQDDNRLLKRQIEETRDQLSKKDLEMKNYHRGVTDLEKQLAEAQSAKERQDEKVRYTDRQALIYREENEKINNELNLTRERLARLEERYRDLENENKTHRSTVDNHQTRISDDLKLNSTMSLNIPTSREYGRFTLTTAKYSSSTVSSSRETNLDSGRYTTNGSDDLFRQGNSPRSLLKISDYINEKPTFPQPYVPPSRPLYSPIKSSPTHQMPVRDLIDNQIRQSEQLEEKFDELLRKKRDLESRINRIPTRGLTNTDRQLLDVLEREIERVEQQISSVKLELRKLNILRTH